MKLQPQKANICELFSAVGDCSKPRLLTALGVSPIMLWTSPAVPDVVGAL